MGEGLSLASSARLSVAENAASGSALGGGYASPPATRNVESIHVDDDNGQITVAFTTRVAPAGSNTIVLVPSLVYLYRLVLRGTLDQEFEPLDQRFDPRR